MEPTWSSSITHSSLLCWVVRSILRERGHGVLFAKDFVILDEAHTIEDVASRHIGLEVSQLGLRRSLQRLYNPSLKERPFQAMKNGPACQVVAELIPKSEAFFSDVSAACVFKRGRACRVREPGLADAAELSGGLVRLSELLKIEAAKEATRIVPANFEEAASRLQSEIRYREFSTD